MRAMIVTALIITGLIFGALLSPYLLGTATPTPTPPMSADEANAVGNIVKFEMTAAARQGTATASQSEKPMEVYVVGIATPVQPTPSPVITSTPMPACPQKSGVCKWPVHPAAPDILPTSTPYPICATPEPGKKCTVPPGGWAATTTVCWTAGWHRTCLPERDNG